MGFSANNSHTLCVCSIFYSLFTFCVATFGIIYLLQWKYYENFIAHWHICLINGRTRTKWSRGRGRRELGGMVWHCVFSINRKQYAKQRQLNLRIFCQFSALFLWLTAYYSHWQKFAHTHRHTTNVTLSVAAAT